MSFQLLVESTLYQYIFRCAKRTNFPEEQIGQPESKNSSYMDLNLHASPQQKTYYADLTVGGACAGDSNDVIGTYANQRVADQKTRMESPREEVQDYPEYE